MRIYGKCSGKNGTSYKTWVDIETISQSVENNYSIVNIKLYLQAIAFSNSAFNLNGNNYCWITADGQGRSVNRNIDTRNYSLVLLKDENYTIYHETNGSRSFYFDAGFFISSNTLASGKVEGWVTLSTIPRSSHCLINDFTLENDIYINTNRSSQNFTHVIDLYINNNKILSRDNIAQDITIKLSEEEIKKVYELMSTTLASQVRINCSTWNGTVLLGYTDSYATCFIDKEKCKPKLIEQGEASAKLIPIEGSPIYGKNIPRGIVRGYSHITATGFHFEAQNGTSLKEFRLTFGSLEAIKSCENEEVIDIGLDITENEMSYSATLTVADNRGLENSIVYNFYDAGYIPPKILKAEARRKNGVEAECYLDIEIKMQKEILDSVTGNNIKNNILFLGYNYESSQQTFEHNLTNYISNGSYDVEKEILTVNNIPIHAISNEGFEVGKEYYIKLVCKNGFGTDIMLADSVIWNETTKTFYINSGNFLKAEYQDDNGVYHSGYHCLPRENYEHNFKGIANFEELFIAENKIFSSNILYDGVATNQNFQILDNIENYEFTEIYYHSNDGRYCCTKVFNNYKEFVVELFCGKMITNVSWYAKVTDIKITGKQVSVVGQGEFTLNTGPNGYTDNNMNYIDKIIGYK